MGRRESYQDVIDRDRDKGLPAAEAPGSGRPPEARKGYKRREAIDRDLARYYEQCKGQTRGRFKSKGRQKQYCSAVAWKRVESTGRYQDYPTFQKRSEATMAMPKRNSRTGRFMKKRGGKSSHRRSSPSRRRKAAAPAAYAAESRPRRRKGKRRSTTSREAPRRTSRRSSHTTRRSKGRRSGPTNIAIVPVGVAGERRRSRAAAYSPRRYRARDKVLAGAGSVALFTTGAVIAYLISDALDRYLAGVDPAATSPTLPAPYSTIDNPIPKYNNDAVSMAPGLTRIGAQLAGAVLFFLLGAVTKGAALKFFLYGLGGGFTVRVSTQIITAYIIVPMVSSSTGTGARMYQHEQNVYNALANPSGGYLGAGPANRAGAYGRRGLMGQPPNGTPAAPPALPSNQPAARVPVALASQATPQPVAAAPAAPAPAQQQTLGQPPTAGHVPGCKCAQCPQPKEAPASNGNGAATGPHPVWAVLLDRQAA